MMMNPKLAALRFCDLVLSDPEAPPHTERQARLAMIEHLSPLADFRIPVEFQRIWFPAPVHLALCNPSVVYDAARRRYRVVVRAINHGFTPDGAYFFRTPGGFQTENYLADFDENFDLTRVQHLSDAHYRLPPPASYAVTGLEDLRLIRFRDQWWAVASNPNFDHRPTIQSVLVRLRGGRLTSRRSLTSATNTRVEKNWMPAVDPVTGHLRLIYSCSPTVVLRYHHKARVVEPEFVHQAPALARGLRGGSQLIPFDGGYLCLVHDFTVPDGAILRTYFHRWLWFTPDYRIARISPPFYLRHHGVEFVAGLAQAGDSLVISFGVHDAEAWLARLPAEKVRDLLAPPLAAREARRHLQTLRWQRGEL